MARPGVTYEEAEHLFIKLLAQGEPLSAQRARLAFGSGSNSTWSKHLSIFREAQKNKQLVSLPVNLPEALLPAIEVLWTQAVNMASEQFVEERAFFEKEVSSFKEQQDILQSQKEGLKSEVIEANKAVGTLAKQTEDQAIELHEKEKLLQELQLKLVNETQRCREMKDKVTALHQEAVTQHERSLKNIQAIESKFQHETKRHEEAETRWMQMYDSAKLETKQSEKNIASLKKQLSVEKEARRRDEKLLRENERQHQSAVSELRVHELELEKLKTEQSKLESEAHEYKKEIVMQTEALTTSHEKIDRLEHELVTRKGELEKLMLEVTKLESKQSIQAELLASISELEQAVLLKTGASRKT